MIYFSYRHGVETPSNDEGVDVNNAITVSINGQPVTIEINIKSAEGADCNLVEVADDDYTIAPVKNETKGGEWEDVDLAELKPGTYIQRSNGDAFFKISGDGDCWIDKHGEAMSSAEFSSVIRLVFELRSGIYYLVAVPGKID